MVICVGVCFVNDNIFWVIRELIKFEIVIVGSWLVRGLEFWGRGRICEEGWGIGGKGCICVWNWIELLEKFWSGREEWKLGFFSGVYLRLIGGRIIWGGRGSGVIVDIVFCCIEIVGRVRWCKGENFCWGFRFGIL